MATRIWQYGLARLQLIAQDACLSRLWKETKTSVQFPGYDCTRENLGLIADTSLSGARVARELTAMIRIYGKPDCIVSDNGTEFTSTAILKWAGDTGVA